MNEQVEFKSTDASRGKLLVVSLVSLFVGFFIGVGFTTYKLTQTEEAATISQQSVDSKKEIQALEMTVAQDAKNIMAWVQLGHAYYDTHQYNKAIDAYEKSLVLDPNKPDILTDLGVMYRRSKQPEKAIQSFEKAISIDPKHETAMFNKGIVLMHDLNEKEKALKIWEELLEINPIAMAGKDQSLDELIKHYKEHEENIAE